MTAWSVYVETVLAEIPPAGATNLLMELLATHGGGAVGGSEELDRVGITVKIDCDDVRTAAQVGVSLIMGTLINAGLSGGRTVRLQVIDGEEIAREIEAQD